MKKEAIEKKYYASKIGRVIKIEDRPHERKINEEASKLR